MPMLGSECGGCMGTKGRPDSALAFAVDRVFASLAVHSPPVEVADARAERAARPAVLMPAHAPMVAAGPSWAVADEDASVRVLVPSGR